MLRPREILIHDGTPLVVTHAPTVDGQPRSRGAVPRDYSVQPLEMFEPPDQMVVIPQSEWAERIADKVANKSQLSDIRLTANGGQPIPSLDQDGVGYCHTGDTEVLTEKGWTRWPDYNYSDLLATVNPLTHRMEFQTPFERHVYDYDGEMVYGTNRRLDFGVTADHRMLVRKWDEAARTLSSQYTFQRAGDIGWYAGMMHAPAGWLGTELVEVEVPGDRRYDGDDFVAMLSLIVSDGFAASYEHSGNLVSFASFRPECRERVAALAARLGFREQPSRPGVWNRWGAGALAQWLFANCYTGGGFKAQHKKVPDIVKVASGRQIEHFLTWNGDQNHNRDGHGEHYYSSSKRMIDDLQELCLRVGRRGTITHRDPRTGVLPQGTTGTSRECWELVVGKTDRLCIERKKHIERDRYKGPVYCAAVPNGTLITRRNGTVLISGNCWAHSTTSAMMLVRATKNLPYVPLSAFCVAATIKKGRDEGGWGGLSAQFARERGIPTQAVWPQGDRNYSKYDKPETWANAALHKSTEEWVDVAQNPYDQNMAFQLWGTCLLNNEPGPEDHNWWSHSICGMDVVNGNGLYGTDSARDPDSGKLMAVAEYELAWGINHPVTAGFGVRIWNSWGDGWSDRGMGVLAGSKAIPDGCLALRSTTISLA